MLTYLKNLFISKPVWPNPADVLRDLEARMDKKFKPYEDAFLPLNAARLNDEQAWKLQGKMDAQREVRQIIHSMLGTNSAREHARLR